MLPLLLLLLLATAEAKPSGGGRCSGLSGGALVKDGPDGVAPPLSEAEFRAAKPIDEATLEECYGVKPSELDDPNMVEGDMIMPAEEGLHRAERSVLRRDRWPNGRIPYQLSSRYDQTARLALTEALKLIHQNTCIRFVPKADEDRDYVWIFPDKGCYSTMGRIGGMQKMSLTKGCLGRKIIQHEIMHAAGFIHEHSRPDRDQYVRVIYENIKREFRGEFDKFDGRMVGYLGVGYDFNSIMHYSAWHFSKNGGSPTLERVVGRWEDRLKLGRSPDSSMSPMDIQKVNKLYNCPLDETRTTEHWISSTSKGLTDSTEEAAVMTTVATANCFDEQPEDVCLEVIALQPDSCRDPYMKRECKHSCGLCEK